MKKTPPASLKRVLAKLSEGDAPLDEIREAAEDGREWVDGIRDEWSDKSERWQEGETGQKWDAFADRIEATVSALEAIVEARDELDPSELSFDD